ncbi:hypothetical protein [Mucilaginibacter sp. FT3.2]|uniref:hypothetical protein n=1 Tax=Mucilaginibacter sp. FT3.2 TaxID=2723090 RepID=UPI00161F43B0|nr:hypothetical protein [Mucilaginibacter sp. FT3.2]MBB6234578.1 hypothetical protein [Mucilaginibacter sp. FT3.2]
MKITFICASLQTGSDGVGDYVRRLACEIIKRGDQVEAIALTDSYLSTVKRETQEIDGIKLSVLRLPASLNTGERYNYLQKRLELFNPDLVSLQYVGFGFNKYGLPIDILLKLGKAIGTRKLHIMFHELWCGMAVNAGVKEKFLGRLQKVFLKATISALKPETIFTSIKPYQRFLEHIGIKAVVVPIFGNISTTESGNENDWDDLTTKADLSPLILNRKDWLILGFFGTTYNCQGLDDLLHIAVNAAKSAGLKLGVLFIGHNRMLETVNLIKATPDLFYWETGSLSTAMINRSMQLVNIGVVTSPVDGINKSGSAVAWMERGIPVMISSADKNYSENLMEKQGIYQATSAEVILRAYSSKNKLPLPNNLKMAAIAYTVYSL